MYNYLKFIKELCEVVLTKLSYTLNNTILEMSRTPTESMFHMCYLKYTFTPTYVFMVYCLTTKTQG
jgi:hypothetical protein